MPELNPEADPQFLAFLRSMGAREADLRGSIAQKIAEAQRQHRLAIPQVEEQERQGIESAFKEHLGRGFFGGGEHQTAEAQVRAEKGRRLGELQSGLTAQTNLLQSDLARGISGLAQQRAEEELAARSRLAQAFAVQEAERRRAAQEAAFMQQQMAMQRALLRVQQVTQQPRTGPFADVLGFFAPPPPQPPKPRRVGGSGNRRAL